MTINRTTSGRAKQQPPSGARHVGVVEVEGSVIVNDLGLAASTLEGVGGLPRIRGSHDYVDGRVVCLLEYSALPPADGFFPDYPSRPQNPVALRALIDFLRTNLRASMRSGSEKTRRNSSGRVAIGAGLGFRHAH